MNNAEIRTNYQLINVKDISVGHYQRIKGVNFRKVKTMAENFDETLLGTITVSKRRDGSYWVIDGQHRVVLAKMVKRPSLMALVYEGLTYEQEAEYFNKLNSADGEQLRLSKADIFNASVEARDVMALEIKNTVEEFGFKISQSSGPNSIAAINTVEKIYKRYGRQHLHDVLKLLKETWNGETYSLNNLMLYGVSEFIRIYGMGKTFRSTFVTQLSKVDPKVIVREAKGDMSTNNSSVKVMNSLFKYYNARLKNNRLENKHFA